MKRFNLPTVSLALNLVLAGWIVWRMSSPSKIPPLPPATPSKFVAAVQPISTQPAETNRAIPASPPFHWSQVESTNYVTYIANLRAIDCPEPIIRRLVASELDEYRVRQRQELLAPWQGRLWDEAARALGSPEEYAKELGATGEALEKKDGQLKAEKDQILKALLGDPPQQPKREAPSPPSIPAFLTGYLSDEKQKQMFAVEKKYGELLSESWQKNRGKPEFKIQDLRAELDQQKRQEIQALLTPAELDEFRLRTSPANNLLNQVYGFDPTPDEWRALVRKRMELEEAHPQPSTPSGMPPEMMARYGLAPNPEDKAKLDEWKRAREQARVQVDEQDKALLGPDRYAAFQRAQQGDFQQALRVAERCELPATVAVQVYDYKRAAEASALQVRENKDFNDEQRQAALAGIRGETERALLQAFGDRAFKTYSRYGGEWLKGLGQP